VAADDPRSLTEYLKNHGIVVTQKPEGIRVSTHFYNNDEDLQKFVAALKDYRETTPVPQE
jgi:selenocysteine lyase/cysteine desulfurase